MPNDSHLSGAGFMDNVEATRPFPLSVLRELGLGEFDRVRFVLKSGKQLAAIVAPGAMHGRSIYEPEIHLFPL
jgi:hypothetical protein